MSRTREFFRNLVEKYTDRECLSVELFSDSQSTAIKATMEKGPPLFFLCIDRPLGSRAPLTAIELEEVEFTSWPPTKHSRGSAILAVLR